MKYCLKFNNYTFSPIVIRQKFCFQASFLFAKFFSYNFLYARFLQSKFCLDFYPQRKFCPPRFFSVKIFCLPESFMALKSSSFQQTFTGWPSVSWLSRCCTDNLEMFRLVPALVLATALLKMSSLFSQKLRYGMDFKAVEVNFT